MFLLQFFYAKYIQDSVKRLYYYPMRVLKKNCYNAIKEMLILFCLFAFLPLFPSPPLNSFIFIGLCSVQFSSVAQLCLTLCNPINHSTPGLIHHQLLEFTQTHVQSVMPSSHFILCCPLLLLPQSLPASGSFPMSQLFA